MTDRKSTRLLNYKSIDENAIFFKEVEGDRQINLGVCYFEDGKIFERDIFYSYPDVESFRFQIGINGNLISVIENKEIVCMFDAAARRRVPSKQLEGYKDLVDSAKVKTYKPEVTVR